MVSQYSTIRSKTEWDAYVNKSLLHEIFHTWYYHSLNTEGEPLLFVYEQEFFFIALPVIKRKIGDSPFFDMTSVYGYSGPISNIDLAELTDTQIEHFKIAFTNFMKDETAICIFSRLHPFVNQHHLLENLGGVKNNGKTLYIDLSATVEEQRARYDKRLLRQIRKLREKDYVIRELKDETAIKNFVEMYRQNMDRVNASAHYYFDEQYFVDLLNAEGFENKLILIFNGTELICGALLLLSDEIIRNHLSATAPEYLSESPSKLLTDEIAMIGRRLKKKIFHLGGGVGGKQDSLFAFKKNFSDQQIEDRIWCYINDDEAYSKLVLEAGELDPELNYFPSYRQPKKSTQPYIANIETTDN